MKVAMIVRTLMTMTLLKIEKLSQPMSNQWACAGLTMWSTQLTTVTKPFPSTSGHSSNQRKNVMQT
eukprot:4054195-Karenia_brevis.AAC.1